MNIVSQFIENLKSLSKKIFITTNNLEPLLLNDDVSSVLSSLISNKEITDLISSISNSINSLNVLISPITEEVQKEIKQKQYPLKQIPYASFIVDEPPIIKNNNDKTIQKSFEEITKDDPIKPVKRKAPLKYTDVCPHCGAPNEYIYSNVKGEKQYKCKCCSNTFTLHPHYHEEISYLCPHCSSKLSLHHDRDGYDVLFCQNYNCSFYLKNKKLKVNNEAEHLKVNAINYKLHYYFRLFNINFDQIKNEINKNFTFNSKINLKNIHHSQFALGLILTYYVNYGLSCRRTAQILEEIHGIKVSYQTVINYAEAAAKLADQINKNFNYDLSDTLSGDETYIKVNGKTNYVFFFSDTSKKIITSYRIFPKRDTICAIKSIYESISKYKVVPENLNIITDGNPIYNAAQIFFSTNNIKFDLYQVIGVKNNDDTSKLYRPYKQIEERLNRTYKQNYYGTNGYGSYRGANIFMSLYVAFFNFLRKHSSLENKTPIIIDKLYEEELMPNRWLSLLDIALTY